MEEETTKIISVGQIDIESNRQKAEPNLNDLPIIATRDLVLFPGVTFPITLGRQTSISTANIASKENIPVGIFCQLEPSTENPGIEHLYPYGVVADVLKVFDLPAGTHTAILSARSKVKMLG
ncbi:MAG: LON peptidase substrate-binding domain-containing protein, partial [Duncaniella sp.]|nr:LON peptidase substrate-binding domain-containing protein [Duncaniella sp.]